MTTEANPTTPTRGEREQRIEAAIGARLDEIADRHEARILDGISDMIERHSQPNRDGAGAEILNRSGERVTRLGSPYEPLYRAMTPQERRYRSPDSDHWMREFLAGVLQNNGAQQMQARAKLDGMFPDEAAQQRADTLEGAADAAGGFAGGTGGVLMPRVLENLVAIARDLSAKMPRFATTYTMTTQEHNVPTGEAMTAFMVGEATSPTTQGEPALAQVPLIAHKSAAKAILGNDLLEDAAVNVVTFFTQRGGAALGVLQDEEWFKAGTGSAPHVTKLSGTSHAETTATILAYVDIVNMYTNLSQAYRGNARWFIASDVLGFMANVRDGQGRPFYASLLDPPMVLDDTVEGGPLAGAQGTLLGRPVHEVVLTAGDIWFGDPMAVYAIGRRGGLRVETSREFLFDSFRTIMLISERIAGNNLDTAGARLASGIASATSA